jgi:hypothetical protein
MKENRVKEAHRIQHGLNQWNRLPTGYRPLLPHEKAQAFDIIKINDEYYSEYPPTGLLINRHVSSSIWYRKELTQTPEKIMAKVTVKSEPTYSIELTLKEAQILKTYCDLHTSLTPEITTAITALHDEMDKAGIHSL